MARDSSSRSWIGDRTKGVLIVLVTIGHALQYLFSPHEDHFEDPFFRFIYMFHMPAFMFLAGFFTVGTIRRRGAGPVLSSRFQTALLPGVFWAAPSLAAFARSQGFEEPWQFLGFAVQRIQSLWFLWSLLVCSAICAALSALTRRAWILCAALVGLLMLPDDTASWLHGLKLTKFSLPFFAAGFFYEEFRWKRMRDWNWLPPAAGIAFAFLWWAWSRDDFVYVSGSDIPHVGWVVMLRRLLAGFLGTYLLIRSVEASGDHFGRWFDGAGRSSLGIYILQMQLFLAVARLGPGWQVPGPPVTRWIAATALGWGLAHILGRFERFLKKRPPWIARIALGSR